MSPSAPREYQPRKKTARRGPQIAAKASDAAPVEDRLRAIGRLLREKKALEVKILNLKGVHDYLEYFVIAGASSEAHLAGMARDVARSLKTEFHERRAAQAAPNQKGWFLLDYVDVVVHIFTPQMRDFYRLDRLWADAVDCTAELIGSEAPAAVSDPADSDGV